jgi:hypothetical protein
MFMHNSRNLRRASNASGAGCSLSGLPRGVGTFSLGGGTLGRLSLAGGGGGPNAGLLRALIFDALSVTPNVSGRGLANVEAQRDCAKRGDVLSEPTGATVEAHLHRVTVPEDARSVILNGRVAASANVKCHVSAHLPVERRKARPIVSVNVFAQAPQRGRQVEHDSVVNRVALLGAAHGAYVTASGSGKLLL